MRSWRVQHANKLFKADGGLARFSFIFVFIELKMYLFYYNKIKKKCNINIGMCSNFFSRTYFDMPLGSV